MLLRPKNVARHGGFGCSCCRSDTIAKTRRATRRREREVVRREVREALAR